MLTATCPSMRGLSFPFYRGKRRRHLLDPPFASLHGRLDQLGIEMGRIGLLENPPGAILRIRGTSESNRGYVCLGVILKIRNERSGAIPEHEQESLREGIERARVTDAARAEFAKHTIHDATR